ncbi:MAG TPA: DVUA0089 family protein, partial [Gemmataceae bacterium]|nr:DVUA0089 family protein [Gemmataceae bacterium]
MLWTRRSVRRPCRKRGKSRLAVEPLELRALPAALVWPSAVPPLAEAEPNDALTQAQDLGLLTDAAPAAAAGVIGNGPAGPADVDWYSFTLPSASHVALATGDAGTGSGLVSALGLYAADPYNFDPPYGSPSGYRLLAQNQGNFLDPDGHLERDLAPGTYYIAVSGAGNLFFHPLLADSGGAGSTGAYTLQVATTDLGLDPNADGPVILGGDPAPGSATPHAPPVIHVDLSAPLNPDSVHLNQTDNPVPLDPFDPLAFDADGNPQPVPPSVWLTYNPTGHFGDGNDQPVLLAGGDVSFTADELRVGPDAPLQPGFYQLFLAGDTSQHAFVVTDLNGYPLGADADHPAGQDLTYTFQVTGIEGRVGPGASPDDTPATAQELGDVTHLVQVQGTIGDNPNFTGALAGADVDLYHFQLTGPGRYALTADAFAGRIGSPLDVGLSLFQLDPVDHHTLRLVTANDNTGNPTTTSDDFAVPLVTDSSIYAGLTAGDYYLAVSAGSNVPDAAEGLAPGVNGVFDLNAGTPYSGFQSLSTGDYVVNVLAEPAAEPPHVASVTPADGSILAAPPTQLAVQFDEPVVLQQLAYQAYYTWAATQQGLPDALAAVAVVGADGTVYHPRLQSYDPATSMAHFLMLDALPSGSYALHLSGASGLTDFAGQPLVGNDPSGDYVIHFQVQAAPRGTGGDPTLWTDQEPNDSPAVPQVLGTLFHSELQSRTGIGVTVRRDFSQDPAGAPHDTEDNYQIQVLESHQYVLNLVPLSGSALPEGTLPELYDASGNPVLTAFQVGGTTAVFLTPGTYTIRIAGWSADQASGVSYELHITLLGEAQDPTPLTV